ncbi:MAG: septum site-determining protein MinD, partial [Lachnospiraceae bacterium]|nr:septum site-determining protein MinD [Lachnospiraceae bacterium]
MDQIELIVNRIRIDMVKRGDMMSLGDVRDVLSIALLGAVPDDEAIVISTNRGEPLTGSNTMAGIAYSNICRRILGYDVPLMNFESKTGFFSKVSGLFRR